MAVYAYEGIGTIIPVMEACDDEKFFPVLIYLVFISITVVYVFFGTFTYFVWGAARLNIYPMIV